MAETYSQTLTPPTTQSDRKPSLSPVGNPEIGATLPDLTDQNRVYLETNTREPEFKDESNGISITYISAPDFSDQHKLSQESKNSRLKPELKDETPAIPNTCIALPEIIAPVTIYHDPPKSYPSARQQMDNETSSERRIDRILAKERKLLLRERTIILLGTGSSGKSTVFKQMKLQHGSSFGFEERQDYKSYIHQFILCNVKKIISLVSSLKYSYDDQETLIIAKKIMAINVLDGQVLDQETALGIQKLLKSASVELIMKRSFERNLDESFGYFYKSPGSFLTESYLPSDQDILMCRHKTNYIVKSAFTTKDHIFNVIDVAGQRDKRSRWSQYCEKGVEAVVVLVSAVSFNQYMEEDPKVPCMKDSINMLTEILKNASLKNSAIIILINKIDLLEERLRHYNVSDYFRNYSQKNTPKKYLQFLKRYFYSICKEHGKSCYVYETTATDQLLMRKIIDSIL